MDEPTPCAGLVSPKRGSAQGSKAGGKPPVQLLSLELFSADSTRGVSPSSSGEKPALLPAGWLLPAASLHMPAQSLHLPPRPNLTYRQSSRADMLPTRTCPPGAGQGHRGAAHQEGGTEESGTSQVIPATWEHNSLLLPSHLCCQRRPRCQPPLLVPNVSQSQPILGGNYKFMGLHAGLRPNTASFIRFSAQRICRQIKPPDSTSWLPAGCSTPEPLSATSHLLTWPRSAQACRAHGAPVRQLSPGTRGLFLFAQQPLCKVAEGQVWILTVSHPRAKHTLEA